MTVTVDVADNAPASVTNRAIVAGGGDVLPTNNVVDDVTAVTTGPDLTITKTHPNSFGPGQTGVIFILTVTNRGGSPTQGRVEVVDDLPVGLTAKAASGGGWTCEVTVDTVACTRTDALAPGASYPAITLTADVAADLAIGSTLTNRATVSRGGDVNPGNNTAEDSEILDCVRTFASPRRTRATSPRDKPAPPTPSRSPMPARRRPAARSGSRTVSRRA